MRLLLILASLLLAATSAAAEKRIALSFDDVPRAPGAFLTPDDRTRMLVEALDRAGVEQAAFFVTTGNLDRPYGAGGEARIAAYVAAGHVIANHSHSHFWLHRTPAETYVADLDRAAAWLAGRPGYRPWYRFPFLDEGRQNRERREAVRAALRERGLRNGYVTIDTYDWYLENLARDAVQQGKTIDRDALRDLYVESLVALAEFNEQRAVETLGRSPAHVLLLHETDLAALFIADAVAALRERGWQIVTADEAYRDPIAAVEPDTPFLGSGRVAAIAHAAGRPARELVSEWTEEDVLSRRFAERVLHETVAQPQPDDDMAMTRDTPLPPAPAPPPSDPRIIPIPDIPAPLRGCWVTEHENVSGERRLIVTARTLVRDGDEATADYVNRVSETWIDGRFASAHGDTVATMLELADDDPDMLILREGDAGSYHYSRCRP